MYLRGNQYSKRRGGETKQQCKQAETTALDFDLAERERERVIYSAGPEDIPSYLVLAGCLRS